MKIFIKINNKKVFSKCFFSKIISFQKGKVVLAVAEPYVHHQQNKNKNTVIN